MNDNIHAILQQCLENSLEGGRLSSATFFQEWFRYSGYPYHFIFKKNLRVTNLQIAELIALLKSNTVRTDGELLMGITFLSSSEFRAGLDKLIEGFSAIASVSERIQHVSNYMLTLSRNTIVCDIYFGSAVVFLPPGLKCDMAAICARSGYIYACGPSILFRNINKVTKEFLYERLDAFLQMQNTAPKLLLRLVIYAHEDFTKHDRTRAAELINGLDDLKIFVEKYYIGTERLVTVLGDLEARYDDRLHIMEPGPFRDANQEARDLCDSDTSLWMIVDHGLSNVVGVKGDDQYLACYKQEFFNNNPFHLFDENKPAWIDHTTIPHTLMGAMLNLTTPWWPKDREPVIGDPFVGTGTTWLEAAKYGPEVQCSDLLSISPILCDDNARFFCLTAKELEALSRELGDAENISFSQFLMPPVSTRKHRQAELAKKWLIDVLALHPNQQPGEALSKETEDALRTQSELLPRLLFYISLRTGKRHIASFIRRSEDWEAAYKTESEELRRQIGNLIELYGRMGQGKVGEGQILVFPGEYSLSVCPPIISNLSAKRVAPVMGGVDVRQFPVNSCDVIISDPPYGFNTEISPDKLATLFQDTITVTLNALKTEGQLVIALPDWSHIGRELPFFVLKEMFTRQLVSAATEKGMEVVGVNYSLPSPSGLLKPPYYWESSRALRRAILHFRFRKVRVIPSKKVSRQ